MEAIGRSDWRLRALLLREKKEKEDGDEAIAGDAATDSIDRRQERVTRPNAAGSSA